MIIKLKIIFDSVFVWALFVFLIYLLMGAIAAVSFMSLSAFDYTSWHPAFRFVHALFGIFFLAVSVSVAIDEFKCLDD